MRLNREPRWGDLRVAIIAVIAIAFTAFMIIKLDRNKGLFEGYEVIEANLTDPRGLRLGAPVHLSGIEVGEVTDIQFKEDASIHVRLRVRSEVRRLIRQSAFLQVDTLGVLGDRYVLIDPGNQQDPVLPEGEMIKSGSSSSTVDMLSDASKAVARLRDAVETLNEFLDKAAHGDGTLAKLVNEPTVMNEAEQVLTKLNKGLSGSGSLAKLINDPALHRDLAKAVKDLSALLNASQQESSTVGRLMREDALYEKLEDVTDQVSRLAAELSDLVVDIKKKPKKYFSFSVF